MNDTERKQPDVQVGLTTAEVAWRREQGLTNDSGTTTTKSTGRIVADHVCTLFNLINAVLAVAVLAVGSYKNCLFMGVVLSNLVIGIVQELRAKRTIDRLSLIASVKATVLRDGQVQTLAVEDVVLDDVLVLQSGQQIVADCVLLTGECEVNESMVTGEADAIHKRVGDTLLSGSFVVSGSGRARVEHVGRDNYIATISEGAKKWKRAHSEIMYSLKKIIKIISIFIFPIGAILFYNQVSLPGTTVQEAVVQSVAALIGMIPEGLMLLTSTVLAVSVVRLSKHHVLVQDLYCIEALARVDTLCLDKTGTLTEGCMEVADTVPLTISQEEIAAVLRELMAALDDQNATAAALRERFHGAPLWTVTATAAFSSRTKWSGAQFVGHGSYILGAAEMMLPQMSEPLRQMLTTYARDHRVLLLAHSDADLEGQTLPAELEPVALVLLRDKLRPQAQDTLRYFAEQGVTLKVISGDSIDTVAGIAKTAGIEGSDRVADMSRVQTEEELRRVAEECCVFGRVTPTQKQALIAAMKQQGHTVAMTGDGVNDVLALKEADCSIAMASGTDAARTVSQLVLLHSNFDSLPKVVAEGRRSINNIQRSAALFLVKTIYSTLFAIAFLFLPVSYPFVPIQLSLISTVSIGIPSMVLALEPNRERVRGHFLRNVLLRALPGALTIVYDLLLILGCCRLFDVSGAACSTLCTLVTGFSGLLLLYHVCQPFNRLRLVLFGGMCALFAVGALVFRELFSLVWLSFGSIVLLALFAAIAVGLFHCLEQLTLLIFKRRDDK